MSKEAKFHLSEHTKAKLLLLMQECPCLMQVSSSFYKGNAVVRYNIPLNAENTIKSY